MRWSKRISLGQHTLIDDKVVQKIIDASQIKMREIVCEAGAGNGILTRELCKHSKFVISYEVDGRLFEMLNKGTFSLSNLKVVNADIFKMAKLNFDVFVSNLPYSKSKDAFGWLSFQKFDRAIVMVQKEFADKLQASPGEKNYRAISVIAQHCFDIHNLFRVDRKAFEPEPSVESEVIRIVPKKHSRLTHLTIKNINSLFSQKNRLARSMARKSGSKVDFGNRRIRELNVEEIVKLAISLNGSRSI
jgi:16S rRNA (adenine1518-N6/adenine1519-N6)-dimethyltransferase